MNVNVNSEKKFLLTKEWGENTTGFKRSLLSLLSAYYSKGRMRRWLKKIGSVTGISLGFRFFNVILCFLLLAIGSTAMALHVHMDRQEIIRHSKLIFVGSVLEKNARWNEIGNLIVTDYVFAVEDVLLGQVDSRELTLTFAGGQLAEEGHSISGVPEFKVGDHVLLMLEESDYPLLSPVTGGDQGKFLAGEIDGSGNRVVLDSSNRIMKTDDGENIYFEDFVEMIKSEIAVAKGEPSHR